jgi:hypothetical protein
VTGTVKHWYGWLSWQIESFLQRSSKHVAAFNNNQFRRVITSNSLVKLANCEEITVFIFFS